MNNYIIYSLLVTLLLSIAMYPIIIPILIKLKGIQFIREEGPKTHFGKKNTPTMGGIVILGTTIVGFYLTKIVFERKIIFNVNELLILFPFIFYGLIGLIDDGLVIVFRNNKGLSPKIKLFLQIIGAVIYFYIYMTLIGDTTLNFFGYIIDIKGFYGLFMLFLILGVSNGVNLTDGLDGLASGISIIVISSLAYLIYLSGNSNLLIFCLCIIGSLIGFLFFNFNPAKIFMGDTGSLAIGSAIASIVILSKLEMLLILIGFTYIIETLSVIIQVTYFKKTRGKRIFKMTPLHHHFELCGIKEVKVVMLFYLLTILTSVLGVFVGVNYL